MRIWKVDHTLRGFPVKEFHLRFLGSYHVISVSHWYKSFGRLNIRMKFRGFSTIVVEISGHLIELDLFSKRRRDGYYKDN